MKRMFTAALTLAALAATPATQALGVTPKQAAKIAKRVFDREIQQWEASRVMPAQITTPVDHAATADHATTAAHATTAGHSTNASYAVNAGRAITAGHATTADRAANVDYAATAGSATSAETAEVAGVAENANPMAYAYITNDGHIDGPRSSRDIRYNGGGSSGDYCFSAPRPKGIQVTAELHVGVRVPIRYPVVVAGLGQGENCPAGTEFYVQAFNSTDGQRARVAFFLSLVL